MAIYEGRIYQINRSRGGVPKLPVEQAIVTREGIAGDAHRDRRHHGGPQRALCLYTMEEIERLQAEGHPITPGAVGENLTLVGIPQATLAPGARLLLGEDEETAVEIELTAYTTPCANITQAFVDGNIARIAQKRHPGESRVYARVLREGELRAGMRVRLTTADAVGGAG